MRIILNSRTSHLHAGRGIGVYARMLAQYLPQVDPTIELTSTNPDLIHFPNFDLFFLNLPLRKTCPWVVTIHDVIPLIFPEHFPPGIRGQVKFALQNWSLHRADAIITDSLSSKKDIIKYLHIPASKIHVIYLGVDQSFRPLNLVRKTYILYVGDVNYNKNLPALLQAFSTLPQELSLSLASRVWGQSIREVQALKQQIKQLGIAKRVRFDTHPNLLKLYNQSQIYVQPSLYEGFGLPVLEAMACGTPVVATSVASLPEICSTAAIMVSPDSHDLASGMHRALALNPKQRRSLIKSGLAQAAKFTWDKTARETIKVYNQILLGN